MGGQHPVYHISSILPPQSLFLQMSAATQHDASLGFPMIPLPQGGVEPEAGPCCPLLDEPAITPAGWRIIDPSIESTTWKLQKKEENVASVWRLSSYSFRADKQICPRCHESLLRAAKAILNSKWNTVTISLWLVSFHWDECNNDTLNELMIFVGI